MTTIVTQYRQTGCRVGETEVFFGLLWSGDTYLMTDWTRQPKEAVLDGVSSLTVFQLFGMGPRTVTYRLFFETVADFQALDALVQQNGRLRIFAAQHTVPVDDPTDEAYRFGQIYTNLPNVLLRSLISLGVAVDGTVEADASFVAVS